MDHQATTGENAQKNRKKKNLNNGTSAILWQVGENAATVEWLLYIVTLLRIIASH